MFSRRLLVAGLAAIILLPAGVSAPVWAADPAPVSAVAAVVADPTELATDEDKVEAARVLGINPGIDMLVLNDQEYVLSLWRQARTDSFVKAEALRAYDTTDPQAAYAFIKTGIFAAAADDAQAEITAERAKALRRSVAVTVGLDPADTALIELADRDFIFAVWQRVPAGSHVKAAAEAAIAAGTGPADWTAFLTTGAQTAHEQDITDAIRDANEAEAARLRAEQLATAKRSLLQLLLLPVTEELVNAPNRQYVLHVKNTAKGTEVLLAAQAALNAPDATLDKALSDFIYTGGAAANALDEKAAAAKELAGYRTQVTAIRDAARLDGVQPNLTAAADRALTDNTVLALQTFLLKGQDAARALDQKSWASVVLAGDRIGVLNTGATAYAKDGGLSAAWVTQRAGVKQFALSGERVGVLTTDGTAYVREGALNATTWVTEHTSIQQIALAGDRIGVVTTGGIAYVKDGGLSAAWSTQRTGITELVLAGERVGVVGTDGNAYVREGALTAAWVTEHSSVRHLALDGTRIGVLRADGVVWVKEGGLSAAWVNELTT